jgi:hypothetical protein
MKILIISHNAFSNVSNNGKTLSSLFKNWPKEDIAQLFFHSNENLDYSVCLNYYQITDLDILNSLIHFSSHCGKKLQVNNNIQTQNRGSYLMSLMKEKERLVVFRDIMWKTNIWKTKELDKWIRDFSPQLIFFIGGGAGFSHEIAFWISVRYTLPLCVFFTDDYVLNPLKENLIDFIQAYRKRNFFNKTIGHAEKCFVIGDMMANAYSKHYHKKFISLMNCVDIPLYRKAKRNTRIIFSYFGGLHLNRWKSIAKLGLLLFEASKLSNVAYVFNVYSASKIDNKIQESFILSGVNFRGCIESPELEEKMRMSDVLVHVESFEKRYSTLTKYSVSTKIPEYLASGRCVLAFGPMNIASIRLLAENNISIFINGNDSNECTIDKLKMTLEEYDVREEIGYNGYLFAQKNFFSEKVRKRLLIELNDVLKKPLSGNQNDE